MSLEDEVARISESLEEQNDKLEALTEALGQMLTEFRKEDTGHQRETRAQINNLIGEQREICKRLDKSDTAQQAVEESVRGLLREVISLNRKLSSGN